MATGILGIGASALLANQQALATVSHNIANATVEGYSRQSVEFQARTADFRGGNFFGTGVDLSSVRRHVNEYINAQIHADIALQGQLGAQQAYLTRIDNLLATDSTGLSGAFDQFFSALQDMSADPASLPQREVVLQQAANLADRFNNIGQFVTQMEAEINLQIKDQVAQINSLAANLAQLNQTIAITSAAGDGQSAGDLLDQRDRLYNQLSALAPISTVDQSDGSTSVFIGKGQPLVIGAGAFSLATQPNEFDSSRLEVTYQGAASVNITGELSGGSLGGLLASPGQIIDPVVNQLGRIAVGLEQSMNNQHRLGMDLDGLLGGELFSIGSPLLTPAPGNTGITGLPVAVSDPAGLTAADYRLEVDAGNNYLLTNLDDGTVTNLGAVPAGPGSVPVVIDGLTIDLAPGAAVGDRFLLQPTRGMASSISLTVTDPRKLAAASPLAVSSGVGNTGSAELAGLQVIDSSDAAFTTTNGALTPPLLIQFTGAGSFDLFDNSNPAAPVLLEGGNVYAAGAELFPTAGGLDYGYRLQLTGTPVAGDSFQVDYNLAGTGDNQNLLAMVEQQNQGLLSAGSNSYQESYQQLVGSIGARTSSGEINLEAVGFMLEQSQSRQLAVAGVNLDEEAAKLLEFQQAYQAAAQTISAADTLFQSLLEVI